MKYIISLTFCLFYLTSPPLIADPKEDATYIVEQHLISGNYDEKFKLLMQDTLANMTQSLERLGAKIIDPDRFLGLLVEDTHLEFMPKVREHAVSAFQDILTPEELASVASFYRSDEGQNFLEQSQSEETFQTYESILRDGPGEPLITHMPELLASMSEPIREWRARITELFSPHRMADILEMESVVEFVDENRRQRVVEALREVK